MLRRAVLTVATAAALALPAAPASAAPAGERAHRDWGTVATFQGATTQMCRDSDQSFRQLVFRQNGRHAQRRSRSDVTYRSGGEWVDPVRRPWVKPGKVGRAWVFGFDEPWPMVRSTITLWSGEQRTQKVSSRSLPFC
jgi:hypothetical protein